MPIELETPLKIVSRLISIFVLSAYMVAYVTHGNILPYLDNQINRGGGREGRRGLVVVPHAKPNLYLCEKHDPNMWVDSIGFLG